MIRKVKIQPLTGDEAPFVVSVAIGETVKNNVAIPSGYNKEDVYFFFQNLKDFKTAFTEDAEFVEEHIKGGEFCSFRILEDMGLESEEVKYVVVNWCASDEEDSAGCFSQYFNSEDEAVEFLRKDLIEFIEENDLLIEDVNTDFEGDGEYKSIDDIPLDTEGSVWYGDVRHFWSVQEVHEYYEEKDDEEKVIPFHQRIENRLSEENDEATDE